MTRFLVLVMRTPRFDAGLIEAHRAFLDALRREGRLELAGGFADRSGGAYLLRADSLPAAQAIAAGDPLVAAGASVATVHEWHAA
ncbi:MAG TPA: YciI family protein [Rhodanobacteraceae bacterium]|nr:YciI family protein [Rhodanobacteraceae bacterium]